ncbi:MAG TPA: hypothetical protein PLM16_02280 [Candidatus Woesebacteria bacterium]|nr:hypothetical protein [Candidatus Woesebacteria bacterium]
MTSLSNSKTLSGKDQLSSLPSPTWNIMGFYRQSIQLLKQNPKLLLLAIASIVLMGGSSFNSIGGGNFSPTHQKDTSDVQIEEQVNERTTLNTNDQINTSSSNKYDLEQSVINNESLSSSFQINELTPLSEDDSLNLSQDLDIDTSLLSPKIDLPEWFEGFIQRMPEYGEEVLSASRSVPKWIYFFFGFQILIMMVFGFVLLLALGAWVQGALIEGVNQADKIGHNQWRLADVTRIALKKLKPMIWVTFVPLIKVIIWMVGLIMVIGLLIGVGSSLIKSNPILGILPLVGIPVVIFFISKHLFKILYAQIFAMRLVVFQETKGEQAFDSAMTMVKNRGFLSKSFLLSLTHGILLGTIAPLVLTVPLIIAIAMYVKQYLPQFLEAQSDQLLELILNSFTPGWIVLLLSAIIITIVLQLGFSLITIVIKYVNWHWACKYFFVQNTALEKTQSSQSNQ